MKAWGKKVGSNLGRAHVARRRMSHLSGKPLFVFFNTLMPPYYYCYFHLGEQRRSFRWEGLDIAVVLLL